MHRQYITNIIHLLLLSIVQQAQCSAFDAYSKGLIWCHNFCLCNRDSDVSLQCLTKEDIYDILNFRPEQKFKLDKHNFDPVTTLTWCEAGNCLCNKESQKMFACIESSHHLTEIIDSNAPDNARVNFATIGSGFLNNVDEDEHNNDSFTASNNIHNNDNGKRSSEEVRRGRKKNRKNRKNRRKNRHENNKHNDIDQEEATYDENLSREEYMPYDDLPASEFNQETNEQRDGLPLPRQEAINSNPMVTAMQPPTRRQPFQHSPTTEPSAHHQPPTAPVYQTHPPRTLETSHRLSNGGGSLESRTNQQQYESIHQDKRPTHSSQHHGPAILEIPLQRKTVAGKVSEDLQRITEDVQHIRSDVIFNQRILLVTVGVAGVAMLG